MAERSKCGSIEPRSGPQRKRRRDKNYRTRGAAGPTPDPPNWSAQLRSWKPGGKEDYELDSRKWW